ncbi:MAG: chemotaxis response regulator protein-glutamate methylesterase [Bdellovibrionales bacterium RIFOXYD12_FULL_39_22]|nr:MAG: chemotaxis response regulator protein-glutamate methylesterase [Bdellovibrionales bacterium RIFOXYB1_FULL_39_21]OFZ44515.1 MAG: chemotaxis response regulator protein-glutamate methylesterase [Bdellovibrionales bacterium RIFOXYC12_FULL_39_17]OFZ49843.1 MAG: chemotaxis response regulator protein-glutamate methylesterase [Bdellovibrionales bacterium RIFOXYC1_FULL_39_130]OFZ73013.1 MAG: chemotaxis response regulator protein-glutamate methylesterase [Bdellovibrionales bacterium RIFOXYC2_FULL_
MAQHKIKVLVIDDSSVVRHIIQKQLQDDPEIEVIGTAKDPFDAKDKILELRPDVLTLDIEMPKMTGVDFLRQLLPQYPIPVVMVSSLTKKGSSITMKSLELGAVDFISKPKGDIIGGLDDVMDELREKIKIAAHVDIIHLMQQRQNTPAIKPEALSNVDGNKIIAIGVSTGGLETTKRILSGLPHNMPGIVITQHMPAGYTKSYAQTLNDQCDLHVVEAQDGDRVMPGKVLVAPGGFQMAVHGRPGDYHVKCFEGEKVSGHCPSVDVLFTSVAQAAGKYAIGVILTGMGKDGSAGMLQMKQKGAFNIAQDEKTSIVFGMPRVTIEIGAHSAVCPLDTIAATLIRQASVR